jgi:hypothetical protein
VLGLRHLGQMGTRVLGFWYGLAGWRYGHSACQSYGQNGDGVGDNITAPKVIKFFLGSV